MKRGEYAALGLLFFGAQLLIVLASADRIGEPDLAEVGVMALGDAWATGEPVTLEHVLREVRAGPNAPHGGYLVVALLYAALALVFGAGSYLALKAVAIAFATVGLLAWTAVADRLGGRRAAAAAAALLWFCPPSALSGRSIAWGSHPEAAALLGVAAWAVLRGGPALRGAAWVGVALGACVGVGRITLGAATALAGGWAVDRRGSPGAVRDTLVAAGVAVALVVAWMALGGAWTASVTETPGNTPTGLWAAAGLDSATVAALLPLRVVPHHLFPLAGAGDVVLTGIAGGATIVALRGDPSARRIAILAGAAALHLALVATLSPQRPAVPARYLLPLWPLIAVVVAVASARWFEAGGLRRAVAVGAVLAWALPGGVVQADLFEPGRIPAFSSYHPRVYATQDVGKVTYETAPAVNDFLRRRPEDTDAFRLVAGSGAGQDLLMRPPPHPVDPRAAAEQVPRLRTTRRLEAFGWGLAVFAADRPGARRSVLAGVDDAERAAIARGIGMGLRAQGLPLDLWDQDPDAEATREGARRLEAEAAAGTTPPLP